MYESTLKVLNFLNILYQASFLVMLLINDFQLKESSQCIEFLLPKFIFFYNY